MDLPIADAPVVYILYPRVQDRCGGCGCFVTTRPAELHPAGNSSWRLMRAVNAWASTAPASSVALMFEISESTVRRYDKEVLGQTLSPPDLDNIRSLLIDEKHLGRRHGSVTIVLNGDTGELLHMAKGKKRQSPGSFLEQLSPEQKQRVECVGIDRSGAYQSAVEQHLPGCAIVYDRFHLVMNLNQAIDEGGRSEWRAADESGRKLIKNSRYLLLNNPESLGESAESRLRQLQDANMNISTA